MKKFKYRIETYLKFVKSERDTAVGYFNQALAVRDEVMKKINDTKEEIFRAFSTNAGLGSMTQDIHLIQGNNLYIHRLKSELVNLKNDLEQANEELQRRQQALIELQKKMRTLELHKEIEHKKYLKNKTKIEQKKMDEMNNLRRGNGHAKPI
jgi:flagellar export protein FliJ